MAGGVGVLHLEIIDNVWQHRPEKHRQFKSRLVKYITHIVFLLGKHKREKQKFAGFLPGQQEGCSHSNSGSEGDDVGNNQVTLYTHHQDHERNHGLEKTATH